MTTMAASARTRARGRVLPKGWPDFLLQLFLFALVDLAYESSRMLAKGDVATAFVHARDVVSVEQTLGIFNEISVQRFALDHPHILDVANLTYFHAHFGVTTVFMFWLYLRRNDYYYFIRNIVFALDGDRAGRLHALPDRAAADADRPRLHRHAGEVRDAQPRLRARCCRCRTRSPPCPACTPASR